MTLLKTIRWVICWSIAVCGQMPAAAQDYVDRYGIVPDSADLNLGVQPLSHPNGVIGTVMRHDRLLKARLKALGTPLVSHAFRRGADMLPSLADRRLDVGLIGDMPATVAAASGSIWIVGLVEVQQNAIVSSDISSLADLAGKRIGYVPVSTAHATLIRALRSNKLTPSDVKLMAYSIEDLPGALSRKEVDAFAGWEPAVSMALNANPKHHIVFRGQSVDYLVIRRAFERAHPDAARALIAGYVRAINWMRQSRSHLEQAAQWVLEDAKVFTGGKPIQVSVAQVASMTRSGILDVPSAPVIVPARGEPALKAEYELLSLINQLPVNHSWDNVLSTFQYTGLSQVMSDPRQFELRRFNYEN